jgi:hypothetical protein
MIGLLVGRRRTDTDSPELISKLENDYTVYAYDYSEYETPLVGQGMLSRVLASASPTPNAPAFQSGTMITGRVCKNILGLFAKGVQETLEVKLKLVPVPTRLQGDYNRAMDAYRSQCRGMEAFTSELDSEFADLLTSQPIMSQASLQRSDMGGYESLHDMLTPHFVDTTETYPSPDNSAFVNSRPGTPGQLALSSQMVGTFDSSRPPSRASLRQMSTDQGYDENAAEDGPARKRAKLMQADVQRRSHFGTPTDSLRVAASTAASIRGFRPVENSAVANDFLPRAPTPRPGEKIRRTSSLPQASLLRRVTMEAHSPYPMSDASVADDGQISQAGSSPADIPSSPPVCPQGDYAPSSPMLPTLPLLQDAPLNTDSGFQSDLPTEIPISEFEDRSARIAKWHETRRKRNAGLEWNVAMGETTPAPVAPVVNDVSQSRARNAIGLEAQPPEAPAKKPRKSRAKKKAPEPAKYPQSDAVQDPSLIQLADSGQSIRPAGPPEKEPAKENVRGPSSGAINLPKRNPNSRQGQWRRGKISTWPHPSSDVETEALPLPTSEAPMHSEAEPFSEAPLQSEGPPMSDGLPRTKSRAGSGVVRQNAINKQLESAIAAGDIPKFCANCGAINTPTWRPYWIRVEWGDGKSIELGAKTGIHCVEPMSYDGDKVTTYRVYKQWSFLTQEEREGHMYEQLIYCNRKYSYIYRTMLTVTACGDYMRKHNCTRPKEFWNKQENPAKKPSRSRKKSTKGGSAPPTDAVEEPRSTMTDPVMMSDAITGSQAIQTPMAPPRPPVHPPSNEMTHVVDEESLLALQKAIQQSPARILGSKESPIEVEENLSPHPVSRRLFPSPRRPGEFKSLDDNATDRPTNQGPAARRSTATTPTPVVQPTAQEEEQPDKENLPPPQLTDGAVTLSFEFPTSPTRGTPNSRYLSALLKTPTKAVSPPKLPGGPDTPQTPSRIVGLSPFSAHLAVGLMPDMPGSDMSPSLFRTPVGGFVSPARWKSAADDGGFEFNLNEFDFSEGAISDGTGPGAVEALFDLFEDQDRTLMGGVQEGGQA